MASPKILNSIVVKASSDIEQKLKENPTSQLGLLDMLQPFFPLNLTFIYDYIVEIELLEVAMQKLMNRYPEMCGRVDKSQKIIHLNNEGAILVRLENSLISLDDLTSRNFNFEFCLEHIKPHDTQPDIYPLGMTVQNLAENSGMLLSFTFDHRLVDANVCYVIISDFCSLVSTGEYKFEEVQQCNRGKSTQSNNDTPLYEHPEIVTFDSEEKMNTFLDQYVASVSADLPIMALFKIDKESQTQLKKDVYNSATNDEIKTAEVEHSLPSTNDCILTLIYQACFENEAEFDHKKSTDEISEREHPPLGLFINSRFRRNPMIPLTQIQNAVFGTNTRIPKSVDISNPFSIARLVRKDIFKIDENYCQSIEAHVNKFKFCRIACGFYPNGLMMTNWNKLYDWYGNGNLGKGNPIKLLPLSGRMNGGCLINDAPNGRDLDCVIGLKKDKLVSFLEHRAVKKYFKFN